MQKAVGWLRASQLESAYREAWTTWVSAGEDEGWEAVAADGLASLPATPKPKRSKSAP
jgi:hypothetical protein